MLLGGGYVILPLLQAEIKELSEDEICEYYALSQSLPGVIAINTSVFVGYKLAGMKGAITAITGIIMPAFLAIILLANLLSQIVNLPLVESIFAGIGIGVLALLFQAAREMWGKSIVSKEAFLIFLFAFVALMLGAKPALIVIIGIIFAIWRVK